MEAAGSKNSRRVVGRWVVGFAVVSLIVVVVSVVTFGNYYSATLVSTTSSSSTTTTSTFATQAETYTINGLTCHFWQGTPSNVTSLVQSITRDTRFLNATEKGQFMLGNYEKNGPGIQVIGGNRTVAGITIHTPVVLELVFYSSLSGPTTCQQMPAEPRIVVVVHVPIQGGLFNMTDADFDCSPAGPWCPSTIHISTFTSGGSPTIGYDITLWENGAQIEEIGTCFSYCFFFATNGQTYQIGVGSNGYGSETFSHWQNDGSTGLETVIVPTSDNQSYSIQLTAIYNP